MKYKQDGNVIFAVIDKGEDLFSSLYEIQKEVGFTGAQVSGIGALKNSEIGFYHCDEKNYDKAVIEAEKELLSLSGNFTYKEGEPFFHLHTVLGNEDFTTCGGHLFSAIVAVTCEVFLQTNSMKIERKPNSDIGLSLCEL
jgi:predicted DNA-binding protein with PD1-like motif